MQMTDEQIYQNDARDYLPVFARYKIVLDHGDGVYVYDSQGRKYIDFLGGIAVNVLGHNHPALVKAVAEQAGKLIHCSNLYYTEVQARAAEKLVKLSGLGKVFFANSGAEANECAIKAARKYSYDKYGLGRSEIITLKNSFHGRTIATLSATGQDVFHQWFFPFVGDFKYCPASDIDALKGLISKKTCAIMIETVQGEGGVVALDPEFIKYIDLVCKENDILFIVDEVQTGNGRCGYLYSYMEYGVTPNIVTTAKGLAGGLPFAAILFDEKTENVLSYGQHGTTFGGNPVCASAALSVLKRIDDKLLNHVRECRKIIEDRLKDVEEVLSISGKGLMVGLELKDGLKAVDIASKCMEEGLIPLTAKTKIRLLPPLNITFEELNKGLDILIHVLKEA